jgi:hypothetical protein
VLDEFEHATATIPAAARAMIALRIFARPP